mgnify:CR=1 FL=1
MIVYYPSPYLAQSECLRFEDLLQSCGVLLRLENEQMMDAATALSGSGPGYVFYFIEHALQAANDLGFSKEQSELMVAQVIKGAVAQWRSSSEDPATLRRQVTSKGGTTSAALDFFEEAGIGKNLKRGIQCAFERARQLGGGLSLQVGAQSFKKTK